MTLPTLDPIRAAAIEQELAAIGSPYSRLQRHQRRTHRLQIALGSVALVGVLTGAAVVVSSFPGQMTIGSLGNPVTGTYTGTASIELGAPPKGAAVVIIDITCTEGGAMSAPTLIVGGSDGVTGQEVGWNCGDPDFDGAIQIRDGALPEGESTTFTVTADPGTVWSATAQYGTLATTEWGTNANGQTYGVPNEKGTPDLTPALATNGEQGYILGEDLFSIQNGYINVYESDGTTVIGKFPIGNVGHQSSEVSG